MAGVPSRMLPGFARGARSTRRRCRSATARTTVPAEQKTRSLIRCDRGWGLLLQLVMVALRRNACPARFSDLGRLATFRRPYEREWLRPPNPLTSDVSSARIGACR